MKKLLAACMVILLATGCTHTSTLTWTPGEPEQVTSSGKKVVWNLTGVNNGMYLFNCIPLWSGYSTRPNRHDYKLFQDQLTVPEMRKLLDDKLKELGADAVEDIQISESSSGAMGLWIVWKRSMRATGCAVKNDSAKTKK
jgi:hypothetical protein